MTVLCLADLQDGLAALDAILDARSKAEKARAAKEDTERLEDLAAKLASMRSMPPAVRTATPTQGAMNSESCNTVLHKQ